MEDKLKSKIIEIINNIENSNLNVYPEENMFLCIYNLDSKEKKCIYNLKTFNIQKSVFNLDQIELFEGKRYVNNFFLYGYKFKSNENFYLVIGYDISGVINDLKNLKKTIFLSSLAVIILSGILAFSVSGRILNPIRENKENLEHVLSIIFHDLRTPITVIKTNLYVMKAKDFKNIENNLYQVERNLDYIQNILKNIEALRSLDVKEVEDININELIKDIIEKLKAKINEKYINVKITEESIINIKANYVDMEIMFTNLLENAIKYNKTQGIIEIIFSEKTVFIKNQGNKIKEPNKIFNKFYREDLAGNIEGLGLGLSIVKKICNKYGFKVKYDYKDEFHIFKIVLK